MDTEMCKKKCDCLGGEVLADEEQIQMGYIGFIFIFGCSLM